MGDRVKVTITIRKCDYDNLVAKYDGGVVKFERDVFLSDLDARPSLVHLIAEECNYGDWVELETLLLNRKIEFDKAWEAGAGFSAGKTNFRLVNGELKSITVENETSELAKFVEKCVKCGDAEKVFRMVKKMYTKIYPNGQVTPLDEQNEGELMKL